MPTRQLVEHTETEAEEAVVEAIAELNQLYFRQGRPYEIGRTADGYQLSIRPQFLSVGRRLHGRGREVRLSVAAIEVLSLVAYRQPLSIQTIDAIRGVESAAIVRQLKRRNLIEPCDPPEDQPRSAYFKTTRRFLELFHLSNLDDLPRLQDLDRL